MVKNNGRSRSECPCSCNGKTVCYKFW